METDAYVAEASRKGLCTRKLFKICAFISSLLICIALSFASGFWFGQHQQLVTNDNNTAHHWQFNGFPAGIIPPEHDGNTPDPFNKPTSNLTVDETIIIKQAEMKCAEKRCCREDDNVFTLFPSISSSNCHQMEYLQCLSPKNKCIWDCNIPPPQNSLLPNTLKFHRHFIGINNHKAIGFDGIPRVSLEEENNLSNTPDVNTTYIEIDNCGTMYEYHLIEDPLPTQTKTITEEQSPWSHEPEFTFNPSPFQPDKRRLGVIGNDDRSEITSWQYPYYHNVYIQSQTALGMSRCSGAFISPRHILTAGHCCGDGAGNFFWDHAIIANLNAGSEKTFSDSNGNGVVSTFVFSAWAYSHNWQWDICILTLGVSNAGFGYFSFGHNDQVDSGYKFDVNGYPHDRGFTMTRQDVYMDWVIENKFATAEGDVVKGASGGPAWYDANGVPTIYGVTSHEIFDQRVEPPLNFANAFARITQSKYSQMCAYMRRFPETSTWCL